MKLTSIDIFRYDLPLVRPLYMMGHKIMVRSGLVIRLKNENDHIGYGEIAPFPGLHQENPEYALQELLKLKPNLMGQRISDQLRNLDGEFEHWLSNFNLAPSVRLGIEMAVLNLLAAAKNCPLYELFSGSHHKRVLINGLLTGRSEAIKAEAKQLVEAGYRTIKLKVGRKPVDSDIATVKDVREAIPDHVLLRLDANRAWVISEAISFGKAIAEYKIDYIEEPLRGPENLSEFFDRTGIPVALDESLAGIAPYNLKLQKGVKALVLKPSILGGLERAAQFSRLAIKQGIIPVISCAFLSGIGLSALAQFAAAFTPANIAMGLDTYKWLQKDILVEPFQARQGEVDVEEVYINSKCLRNDLLKPVTET